MLVRLKPLPPLLFSLFLLPLRLLFQSISITQENGEEVRSNHNMLLRQKRAETDLPICKHFLNYLFCIGRIITNQNVVVYRPSFHLHPRWMEIPVKYKRYNIASAEERTLRLLSSKIGRGGMYKLTCQTSIPTYLIGFRT